MKFVHAADVHLGSVIGVSAFGPDLNPTDPGLAIRQSFDALIELCLREKVSFLLLAGDTFDSERVGISDQSRFRDGVSRLRQAGIGVFMILGNHDPATEGTGFLNRIEGLKVFDHHAPESLFLDEQGVALHGRSFVKGPIRENFSLTYPVARSGYYNIGLLHTSLNDGGSHASYAPCTVADLDAKSYDYWALGHVHTRQTVREGRGGSGWVGFPGNLSGRHIGETGDKGALLVRVADGKTAGVDFVKLSGLNFEHLKLDLRQPGHPDLPVLGFSEAVENVTAAIDGMDLATPTVLRVSLSGDQGLISQLRNGEFEFLERIGVESEALATGRATVKDLKFRAPGASEPVNLPFDLCVKIPEGLFDDLNRRLAGAGLSVPDPEPEAVAAYVKAAIADAGIGTGTKGGEKV